MPEFKLCPFCGGNAIGDEFEWEDTGKKFDAASYQCDNPDCPTQGAIFPADCWNTRPIEDEMQAEIDRLKAENASLKKGADIGDLDKMRVCSYLLPDPGGEVVRELINRLIALAAQMAAVKDIVSREYDITLEPSLDAVIKGLEIVDSGIKKIAEIVSAAPATLAVVDTTAYQTAGNDRGTYLSADVSFYHAGRADDVPVTVVVLAKGEKPCSG